MKVLSLFDGISGARLALDKSNIPIEAYYASEIDNKCIEVSKMNYKDIIHLGDVLKIDTSKLGKIDLLIGGSPCQDLSCAGKRKGLNGERSSLFFEYVRILKDINPTYFLFENVASMKQSDLDIINMELGCKPILINSNLMTAQNRNRYYWTNIENITLPSNLNIFLNNIIEGKDVYCVASRGRKNKDGTISQKLEARNDGKTNTLTSVLKDNYVSINGEIRSLTPNEYEILQGYPIDYTKCVAKTHRYRMIANAFTVPIISHILSFINK